MLVKVKRIQKKKKKKHVSWNGWKKKDLFYAITWFRQNCEGWGEGDFLKFRMILGFQFIENRRCNYVVSQPRKHKSDLFWTLDIWSRNVTLINAYNWMSWNNYRMQDQMTLNSPFYTTHCAKKHKPIVFYWFIYFVIDPDWSGSRASGERRDWRGDPAISRPRWSGQRGL